MPDRKPGKHALAFVLITVLIDMIGIGLILPVLPGLIADLTGVDVAAASVIGGWLFVAYAGMQFLCGPLIGNLSDTYGRRPILLLSLAGLGIDYALTAFAPTILWLFAGRLIAGLCGASHVTANAYIADITPPEERAKAFGMIGAAFGIGFVLGPAIGGLLGEYGHRVPFLVAAALSLANVAYGALVLPESLARDKRRRFSLRRASPLGAVSALRRYPAVTGAATALFMFFVAESVYPALWAYITAYRYGWSEGAIGLSLASWGMIFALVQATLVGPIIARFGERRSALIGLAVSLAACLGYAAASEGWMVYALIVLGCLQALVYPAVNAGMSHAVPADAQGELQGAVASLQGMSSVIGPIVMTLAFGGFAGPRAIVELPGAPFILAAALTGIALIVLLKAPPERARSGRTQSHGPAREILEQS
jgi:DHA1 family tetracycline resistance protein-like MFS transporter